MILCVDLIHSIRYCDNQQFPVFKISFAKWVQDDCSSFSLGTGHSDCPYLKMQCSILWNKCGKFTISKYLMYVCNVINVLIGLLYYAHCAVYHVHKLPLLKVAEVLVLLYLGLFMSCKLFYYYILLSL